jgi:hypothetical protein
MRSHLGLFCPTVLGFALLGAPALSQAQGIVIGNPYGGGVGVSVGTGGFAPGWGNSGWRYSGWRYPAWETYPVWGTNRVVAPVVPSPQRVLVPTTYVSPVSVYNRPWGNARRFRW